MRLRLYRLIRNFFITIERKWRRKILDVKKNDTKASIFIDLIINVVNKSLQPKYKMLHNATTKIYPLVNYNRVNNNFKRSERPYRSLGRRKTY